MKTEIEDTEDKIRSKKYHEFIKYLIYMGGDTDLSAAIDYIENMKNDKNSLFFYNMFIEQQVSMMTSLV